MDLSKIAEALGSLAGEKVLYLTWADPPDDFTAPWDDGWLEVHGSSAVVRVPLAPVRYLNSVVALLQATFHDPATVFLAYDSKFLFTYLRHHCPRIKFLPGQLIDVRYAAGFEGRALRRPPNKAAAKAAIGSLTGAWQPHAGLHAALATDILPTLETTGLLDTTREVRVYPWYTIEGHVNGRLKCSMPFKRCYNPHSLTTDKGNYRLDSDDELFVTLDYRHMEVAVLAFLSGDENLRGQTGQDAYAAIHRKVFGRDADAAGRALVKQTFLPTVFGMAAATLAERHDMSVAAAHDLAAAYRSAFPVAFAFVADAHERAAAAPIADRYGRVRDLRETPHVARNFLVQAAAAYICLENLRRLFYKLPTMLVLSVHDAYVVRVPRVGWRHAVEAASAVLEGESPVAPGLVLSVKAEIGFRLDQLQPIPKKAGS